MIKIGINNLEKKPAPPEKYYYTITVEAMVPTIIKYKVLAETPEEALKLLDASPQKLLEPPRQNLNKMRKISLKIYKLGSCIQELIKRY